jgi:alkylation response protein AidB-like acyl-CoA dehydrogenase
LASLGDDDIVLLELTGDQEVFRQTTAKFLTEHVPVDAVRRLRNDPAGFDAKYWQQGAELGWTSLLISEELGGGTITGTGVLDLSLIAYEFGNHAAPGPLIPTNIVAAALSNAGGERFEEVLDGIAAGTTIATWCLGEAAPNDGLGAIALEIRVDGNELVLNGIKRPVESAVQAQQLLVTGRTDSGLTQVLVGADTPGVTITPMNSVDLTRRFAVVSFANVRMPLDAAVGEIGQAADQVERQLQLAIVMANAESVGAAQACFDMTVQWAFDRYSFGRPLASYQEIKHRFADMLMWQETSHALSDAAATAVEAGSADAAELISAAKAYIGHYGPELAQDCVQMHGGIGVTFEHDLHLYLRRLTVNRTLYGTPADHRQRVAAALENHQAAA